jgi:hypothetical protein
MPKSLIGNSSLRKTLISQSQIQAQIQSILETKAINNINSQKTELIQIMNDYLTQKITRIQTTNKLDILNSKIA